MREDEILLLLSQPLLCVFLSVCLLKGMSLKGSIDGLTHPGLAHPGLAHPGLARHVDGAVQICMDAIKARHQKLKEHCL